MKQKKLEAERDRLAANEDLQALVGELVKALDWMTHLACGVGKRGEAPESGEFETATEQAKAALARARERPCDCFAHQQPLWYATWAAKWGKPEGGTCDKCGGLIPPTEAKHGKT